METIEIETYYAIRSKETKNYVDSDGYQYYYPAFSTFGQYVTREDAQKTLKKYMQKCYPNEKFEIVKVVKQYKITKR